ncbi:MAG: cytochrome c maturation protein CcmE [Acidobacteria bacterium]|nr:cytochrome c maturation protein CcmE [Acidobacteriota bacterium]
MGVARRNDVNSPTNSVAGSGPEAARLPLERPRRRLPVALLGLAALAAVLTLSIQAFTRSVVYYRTPTEVLASPGEQVRLSGKVTPGSIVFDSARGLVTFTVADAGATIRVVFAGTAPDTLKDEALAVAEGKLDAGGVFRADKLFARCPSKFESRKPGG